MQCIIRTVSVSWLGLVLSRAHAADLRDRIQHYRLAHEAAMGDLAALTGLKSLAADPAGMATAHVSELSTGAGAPPAVFGSLKVAELNW